MILTDTPERPALPSHHSQLASSASTLPRPTSSVKIDQVIVPYTSLTCPPRRSLPVYQLPTRMTYYIHNCSTYSRRTKDSSPFIHTRSTLIASSLSYSLGYQIKTYHVKKNLRDKARKVITVEERCRTAEAFSSTHETWGIGPNSEQRLTKTPSPAQHEHHSHDSCQSSPLPYIRPAPTSFHPFPTGPAETH